MKSKKILVVNGMTFRLADANRFLTFESLWVRGGVSIVSDEKGRFKAFCHNPAARYGTPTIWSNWTATPQVALRSLESKVMSAIRKRTNDMVAFVNRNLRSELIGDDHKKLQSPW